MAGICTRVRAASIAAIWVLSHTLIAASAAIVGVGLEVLAARTRTECFIEKAEVTGEPPAVLLSIEEETKRGYDMEFAD